jgi:hypothetical protein
MSERLESMLKIARRMRAADKELADRGGAVSRPISGDPIWDDRYADYEEAFNPRTAEALVKVAMAAVFWREQGGELGELSLLSALNALTAALEDTDGK